MELADGIVALDLPALLHATGIVHQAICVLRTILLLQLIIMMHKLLVEINTPALAEGYSQRTVILLLGSDLALPRDKLLTLLLHLLRT